MEFEYYRELTPEERERAIEFAEYAGVSPTEVMKRMAGINRLDRPTSRYRTMEDDHE